MQSQQQTSRPTAWDWRGLKRWCWTGLMGSAVLAALFFFFPPEGKVLGEYSNQLVGYFTAGLAALLFLGSCVLASRSWRTSQGSKRKWGQISRNSAKGGLLSLLSGFGLWTWTVLL